MDDGTDALPILKNEVYPLKLGYIGVVNRSQREIDTNIPLIQAQKKEQDFFRKHQKYL